MSTEKDLSRITYLVAQFTPTYIDRESLVQDIWLESMQKINQAPSRVFILQRCLNAIRNEQRHRDAIRNIKPVMKEIESDQLIIDDLVKKANLAVLEKQVIYYHFYEGKSIYETSKQLEISPTKAKQAMSHAIKRLQEVGKEKE